MATDSGTKEKKVEKKEELNTGEQKRGNTTGSMGEGTKEKKEASDVVLEESKTEGNANPTEDEKPGKTEHSSLNSSLIPDGDAGAGSTESEINLSVEKDLNNVISTFNGDGSGQTGGNNLDMLMDVNVTVSVELGKVLKPIEEILKLAPGKLLELDRPAGENVDLFLNEVFFARGEVTVINGNYAVRIIDFVDKS